MPLSKRDRFKDRFDPGKFGRCRELRLVEHVWQTAPKDYSNTDCGEEACLFKHDEERDLIERQIASRSDEYTKCAPEVPDQSYLDAIQELNKSIPSVDVLIRWAQNNPPPQGWFDEDDDLL
jgi:hypothetical protein